WRAAMLFHLQFDSPIPPYEQIVAQVIFAIASGSLEVGTLLPSVRELGPRVLVHPNTVAKAYQELERLGVIVTRRGKGHGGDAGSAGAVPWTAAGHHSPAHPRRAPRSGD